MGKLIDRLVQTKEMVVKQILRQHELAGLSSMMYDMIEQMNEGGVIYKEEKELADEINELITDYTSALKGLIDKHNLKKD